MISRPIATSLALAAALLAMQPLAAAPTDSPDSASILGVPLLLRHVTPNIATSPLPSSAPLPASSSPSSAPISISSPIAASTAAGASTTAAPRVPLVKSTAVASGAKAAATASPVIASPTPPVAGGMTSLPRLPEVVVDDLNAEHGQVLVESHPDSLVTAATISIPAGISRQAEDESGVSALAANVLLLTPVTIDGVTLSLAQTIGQFGGTLTYSLSRNDCSFTLATRGKRAAEALAAFEQALRAPNFDATHFEQARRQVLDQISAAQADPVQIGSRVFRSEYYRDSNQRAPWWGTRSEVLGVSVRTVRSFYARAYRRSTARVVLAGAVDDRVQKAARSVVDALPIGESRAATISTWPKFAQNSAILASADTENAIHILGFSAPSIDSPDFGAMYILATLLNLSLSREMTSTALGQAYKPYRVTYDFDSSPANVTIFTSLPGDAIVNGERAVELDTEILDRKIIDDSIVSELKNLAIGHLLTDDPELVAATRRTSLLAGLGLGPNGAEEVLRRIDAVSAADLQRVSRKYLVEPSYTQIIPRDANSQ